MTLLIADCSIRTSADQYLLAIPRNFSQLTASFFGSQCQGILPALLLAWPFISSWSSLCFSSLEVWNCSFATLSLKYIWNFNLFSSLHLLSLIQFSRFNSGKSFDLPWWAQMDSNHRPHAYQACALTNWAMSPSFGGDKRIRTVDPLLARQVL